MTTPNAVLELVGRAAEPGLESSLTAVRLGLQPADAVFPAVSTWPLIVLSSDPRKPEPLIVRSRDGSPFLAAFTSPDRTSGVDGRGRWQLWVRAAVLAAGAKNGVGLVINPGSEPTIRLSGEQLAALAAGSPSATSAPMQHPPGSRRLTVLELTIMAFRAGATPAQSVFDAVCAADLFVLMPDSGDQRSGFNLASADGAAAVFTEVGMIPDDLLSARRVIVRGADIVTLAGGRFDRVVINPNTAYGLIVPISDIPS